MKKLYSDGEFQSLVVSRFKELGEFQNLVVNRFDEIGRFQKLMVEQFGLVHKELRDVKSDIKEIKLDITDIKDVLYPLAKAFDIDSQTVVDHGRRLTRVESHLGLQ